MRRKEREVTERSEIVKILDACKIVRIAMIDDGRPYLVPLNYGYRFDEGELTLTFHSAKSGRKIDILTSNPHVCFEMDCDHALIEGNVACDFGFAFSSIIGTGNVTFLCNTADKREALLLLMKTQTGRDDFTFSEKHVDAVTVFQIVTRDFSAKHNDRSTQG